MDVCGWMGGGCSSTATVSRTRCTCTCFEQQHSAEYEYEQLFHCGCSAIPGTSVAILAPQQCQDQAKGESPRSLWCCFQNVYVRGCTKHHSFQVLVVPCPLGSIGTSRSVLFCCDLCCSRLKLWKIQEKAGLCPAAWAVLVSCRQTTALVCSWLAILSWHQPSGAGKETQ